MCKKYTSQYFTDTAKIISTRFLYQRQKQVPLLYFKKLLWTQLMKSSYIRKRDNDSLGALARV